MAGLEACQSDPKLPDTLEALAKNLAQAQGKLVPASKLEPHAPAAIDFLTRNPGLVPGDLPDELDAAGLLARSKGRPRMIRYGREALRPYGPDGLNPTE